MKPIRIATVLLTAVLFAYPAKAQLAPANEMGVTMGQVQLVVQDVDGLKQFWALLGGKPGKLPNSSFEYSEFPGVLIFWRKGVPSGGSVGSVVNHLGFSVMNLQKSLANWRAEGLPVEAGPNVGEAHVTTPDNLVRIEIRENKLLQVPIRFDIIQFSVATTGTSGAQTTLEMQAWYAKLLGAKPHKEAQVDAASLPGVTLQFARSETLTAPTKGRALDRIGFEITDLEMFVKTAQARGIQFDTPYRKSATGLGVAALTDPWGTLIELNEGLKGL